MKIEIATEIKGLVDYCVGKDIQSINVEDTGETVQVMIEFFK